MLLDTDIFSELLKEVNVNVLAAADVYLATHGIYTISTITVAEMIRGLQRQRLVPRLLRFVDALLKAELLTLELESAVLAGQICGDLERAGQPIGLSDVMIASIALHHNLTLATGNQAHFQRIQALGYSLKLANWRD